MYSEKVPYFILDLLQQVPTVYVPGLGQFEAIFHPAVIDIPQSRIKPPYFEAGFNANEKNAGDILAAYIRYTTGIEQDEAAEAIEDFVRVVKSEVHYAHSYTIAEFGTFSKSENGTIHFTPDWEAFNLSFRDLDVISLTPVGQPAESAKKILEPIQPSTPAPEEEVIPSPSVEPVWQEVKPSLEQEEEKEVVPIASSGPLEKTSRLWWTILTTALILITVLCAYLAWDIFSNRDNINRIIAVTNDNLETSSPDIIIVDTLEFIEEPIPADTPVAQIPETTPEDELPIIEEEEPVCFVVVGAFAQEENVIRMEERLINLGYEVEKIEGGSLTRVAIRASCIKEDLQKTLNEARSTINPDAWVY